MTEQQARELVWALENFVEEVQDNKKYEANDTGAQRALYELLLEVFGGTQTT